MRLTFERGAPDAALLRLTHATNLPRIPPCYRRAAAGLCLGVLPPVCPLAAWAPDKHYLRRCGCRSFCCVKDPLPANALPCLICVFCGSFGSPYQRSRIPSQKNTTTALRPVVLPPPLEHFLGLADGRDNAFTRAGNARRGHSPLLLLTYLQQHATGMYAFTTRCAAVTFGLPDYGSPNALPACWQPTTTATFHRMSKRVYAPARIRVGSALPIPSTTERNYI